MSEEIEVKKEINKKLVWMSNAPWAPTGYGNQTRLFLPRFKEMGYETAIAATWGLDGGIINWGGIHVLPKGLASYGQDIGPAHAKNFGAKYLFTLLDAWVYNDDTFWDGLRNEKIFWIPWFPVDSEPLSDAIKYAVERAYRRLVYSKHGEKMVNNAGLDCTYIPHGVDTKALTPLGTVAGRDHLRKYAGIDLPDDAYIVGMVAANKGSAPSRKAFIPQLEAFAEFKRKHSDAVLYLHTSSGELGEYGGVHLPQMIEHLGLRRGIDVLFPDRYALYMGYPDMFMANMYSALDVHMLVSMGEGFGIPLVEAQACGVPVITGAWTACEELCFSGWKVPKAESDRFWNPVGAWQFTPRVGAIVDALEDAYKMRGNSDYNKRAREGAEKYDADRVTEKYWRPFLDEIFEDLASAESEIAGG